jgi:hypothetical protein
VVVDPYMPNPQDAPLLLHRINTYEELEAEIERLRMTLRDARTRLDATLGRSLDPEERDFESLARDLRAGITTALGDRRVGADMASASRRPGPQHG